jgi:hypothetical protein
MVNGKTPLYLTILAAVVLVGAVIILQPYSADFPGTAYAKPARGYIRAAIHQDSLDLSRWSASVEPVVWGLKAARLHPDSLAAWAGHTQAWTGERRGDTTEVLVYAGSERCADKPIVLRFVGSGGKARVWEASSVCLDLEK